MLSSALAERGVSMRSLEEAIARQVVHGGDLVTNLLEVGGAREEMLVPLLAEVLGLEEAPSGKLPLPPAPVLRLVPGDLAIRHGIFPLALTRRILTIATAEPLSPAVEGDLAFALAVEIRQSVAPLVRIRQAIAEAYQIPLERRFLRLVAKLESRPDPSPTVMPPPRSIGSSRPPPPRLPELPVATPLPPTQMPPTQTPDTLVAGAAPPIAPTRTKLSATPIAARAARSDHPKPAPTVAVVEPKPISAPAAIPAPPRRPLTSDELPETVAAPPGSASIADTADEEEAPVSRRPERSVRRESNRTRTSTSVLRRAVTGDRKTRVAEAPDRRTARPRRKGPFTTAMAEDELGEATTTDAVLDIFFAFAHQFFEYTALFVVHGDVADGRDASGPGAGAARLMSLSVPLDRPSVLALARERRAPVIMPPAVGDLDVQIASELGRSGRTEAGTRAAAVLVLPIVVRNRTVALLYGDDGSVDVELSALGDVIAIAGLTAEAIERAILRKKRGGAAGDGAPAKRPPKPAPPPQAPGAARQVGLVALARAFELPARPADGAEPAPPAAEPKSPPAAISSIAVTLPSASAMAPAMLEASPKPAASPADEISFAGITSSQPSAAPRPAPEPPRVAPPAPAPPAAAPPAPAFTETLQSPTPAPDSVVPRAEPRALRSPDSDNAWELSGRRGGPMSRRRRTPLGVVATGRMRLGPTTPPPPPITAVSRPPEAGPAPAQPPRAARRAIAPSFGGRSKASLGLGAQPLPPEPPPNAIAAPPTPPVPPVRPVVPTAPAPPPDAFAPPPEVPATPPAPAPPVRVPPPGEMNSPLPPETLPGPPVETWAPRAAKDEPSAVPVGSTLPNRARAAGSDPITLVQRFLESGAEDGEAHKELVRLGEAAMQAIMARFPGPLRIDPRVLSRGAELPLASRSGPLLGLIVAIGRPAVPFLAVRSTAGDPDVRFWATHLLGELMYPESAHAIFVRLFDDAAPVRRVARRAAAMLIAASPVTEAPILPTLERLARTSTERAGRRLLAIETLGELAVPKSVPVLIATLGETTVELAEAAHRALVHVTRHDFGRDVRKWNAFWTTNGARGRVEWLIDALLSESPTLRRAAAEELAPIVGRDLGYYDDLPEDEREAAQVRYVLWWEQEGRHKKRS
ncbi:hypothetical protein [Polyangium jinanense]|uniref:Type II secretion system protein GspE N-terminal domain-containing protein n=1 Tax=Polyangium jinanense TaxID=2829994 RepID=A0A9X4AWF6_9BACT|nr:hypothetical protein [Polyangium jinanense]MDC3958662.1 hypothetical protein [Polyangium jinanense]MDC3987289.1 hypothetical protein [Polyangium jinanense]